MSDKGGEKVSFEHCSSSQIRKETAGCYVKARYVLALMMTLGVVNMHCLRNGMSVAILKMVNTSPNTTTNSNETFTPECAAENGNLSDHKHNEGEFDWTISQQTWLLGCYYYGYTITNVPSALLAKRYGMKKVFGISSLLSSVFTLLIPTVARLNFGLLIATRTIIGFLQGATFPALMTGWGDWAPPAERSRLVSFTFGGRSLGNCVIFPLSGFIVSVFDWEAVFYITGGAGLVWSLLWLVLIHDSPATHSRISENEKKYIEESIGTKTLKAKRKVPWRKVFTSLPVLGTTGADVAETWTTLGLTALGPMYMARVLQFDIKLAGFLFTLPFVLQYTVTLVWGFIADLIITTKCIPLLWVRKFSSLMPALLAGLFLIVVAYLGCNKWQIFILLTTAMGILGMGTSGHYVTFLDIAPVYSGVIFSLTNTLNSAIGFLAPQLSGLFIVDNSLNSWRKVFWLAASISFAGGIAYALLASDQVQDWARDPILVEVKESIPLNDSKQSISSKEKEEDLNL